MQFFCLILILTLCAPVFSSSVGKLPSRVENTELQWQICETSPENVFTKLELLPETESQRWVYYTESQNMDLYKAGAVLRTRLTNGELKTAAKLKFKQESEIPWSFLRGYDHKCELDSYITSESIACSLYSQSTSSANLVSARQREFISIETGFTNFQSLRTYGPASSREWAFDLEEGGQTLVIEAVDFGTSFHSIELSVRVPIRHKLETFNFIQRWLSEANVVLCKDQTGKTARLLAALIQKSAD